MIGPHGPEDSAPLTIGQVDIARGSVGGFARLYDERATAGLCPFSGDAFIAGEIGQFVWRLPGQVGLAGAVASILMKSNTYLAVSVFGQRYSSSKSQRVASSSSSVNVVGFGGLLAGADLR